MQAIFPVVLYHSSLALRYHRETIHADLGESELPKKEKIKRRSGSRR
jgi:hypothetical protein